MHWMEGAKRALLAGSAFVLCSMGGDRPTSFRRVFALEPLEPRLPMSAAGLVGVGAQPDGGLSDKIVYVHGGHGYTAANETNGAWSFQRGEGFEMIEDLGNVDQMTFLADYLFRAGATVVPLRPVGHQTNEVVLDNDDAGVTFVGSWSNRTAGVFYGSAGDVPYRFVSTSSTETAYARYQPNIAEEGFYPVYAWTRAGSDRAADQLYRVNHSGGITEVTMNHRRVGNGLVYLGTYHFEVGSSGYVDISNRSTSSGDVVIADMIRFGNGMGDIDRGGGVSGLAREDEAGLYWVQWHVDRSQGVPASEYRATSIDRDATVSLSPRYAEFMNREQDGALSDRVFVSYHSNAGGGRGVLGLYNGNNAPSTATPNQFLLANSLGQEVNNDLVAQNGQYEHDWFNRRNNVTLDRGDIEFGEINNTHINNEFDATIVEVAFHDDAQDAALMRDPKVRDAVARATYQGLIKYFRQVDGNDTPATALPAAVTGVHAESNAQGSVTIYWSPPAANSYLGDAPTGYRIYASTNGYGFDGGTLVAGGATKSATLSGYDPALPYYFKVVAVNAGGESLASEVVTVLPSGGLKQVLVVNGFDRLERAQNPTQRFGAAPNTVERVRPRESNSHDYVVQVASAIHAAAPGVHVNSASNDAVISGGVNLSDYDTVIWILGEESTANRTFDTVEQAKLEQFIASGGNLFVSGSEIGWDLDQQNNGRTFFENTLKGNYVADDANTYAVTGVAGSIFDGLNLSFDNGAQFYNVDFPDVIATQADANAALNYSGVATGHAAIQVPATDGRGNIVMLAFPFETITTAANRTAVMDRVLDFFDLAPLPPTRPEYRPSTRPAFRPSPVAPFETSIATSAEVESALLASEPVLLQAAAGVVPVGAQPMGTLSGKIVYTSPGHGFNFSDGAWRVDRGNNNDIVEDFGNQDQFTYYVDYVFRAGATVVPLRPIGRQINEVVLDNDSADVTYTGSWSNSSGSRYYDEDYGAVADAVSYRFASTNSTTETHTATYTPNIPAAGFYPVYTWVAHGTNRTSQLYKINHTGGQTQVHIDHSKVGNGWVYLGTYHFDAGRSTTGEGSVVISNMGAASKVVIADAIRFGNGMGDLPWGSSGIGTGSTSGKPREEEHSLVWLWRGIGQGVNRDTFFDVADPFTAPAKMAREMNASAYGTAVYIGFHSNAFNQPSARGATGLVSSSNPTPNQSSLATFTARQIEQDMRALGYDWATRNYSISGAYGEINNTYYGSEMDSTIIEVAFHTSPADAAIMRDPAGRDQIARSVYEATLEYFRGSFLPDPKPANITLPSAPTNVRAVSNAPGQVAISWAAGPSSSGGTSGAQGSPATGFRIYASTDGYGFDGGTLVSGGGMTTTTLSGFDATLPYYFKVVAVNAGGESKASEVLTALPSGGAKQVLIVNGFDRFDASQNFRYSTPLVIPGGSTIVTDRVWARYNNSFDYVVQVHTAINAARPGVHVANTSNETVISGAVNLADYDTVIWILGEESTANETFSATEQMKVEQFIAGGGNIFLTGSEIAWDLDRPDGASSTNPTAADRSFFENTLKGNFASNDAGTYTAAAAVGSVFAGLGNITFSNGAQFSSLDTQLYNVDSPDVISPQVGAEVALNYSNGAGAAAIQMHGAGSRGSIVMFGFPFETITSATRRAEVMDRVFDFFGLDIPPANADFNNDGMVDAADYIVWRRSNGTAVPPLTSGDANGDGQVNGDDYQIWRAQYGTSLGAGSGAHVFATSAGGGLEQTVNADAVLMSSDLFGTNSLHPIRATTDSSKSRLSEIAVGLTHTKDGNELLMALAVQKADRDEGPESRDVAAGREVLGSAVWEADDGLGPLRQLL